MCITVCPICNANLVFFDGNSLAKQRGLKRARKSFIRCPKDIEHYKNENYKIADIKSLDTTYQIDNREICPDCLVPLHKIYEQDTLICHKCLYIKSISSTSPYRSLYTTYYTRAQNYFFNNNDD